MKTSSIMSHRLNSKVDYLKDYMMIMLCRTFLLMIGDAKDEAANPTGSLSKMIIVGLGILVLAAIAFLSIFIKGKKVRGEQQS